LSRPIILNMASPGPGGSEQFVVDNQVNGNFMFAYGVTDRLELDFGLPLTFVQTGAGISPLTGGRDLRDTAVRDLRFGFTYALVPRLRVDPLSPSDDPTSAGRLYAIAARFIATAPTGDSTDFAGERTAVFAPSLAGDLRYGRLFGGAEVGVRMRPVSEFAGGRVGTQLTTALGAGVDVLDRERLAMTLEGRAYYQGVEQHDTQQSAFGITSLPNGKRIIPAEWVLGVRSAPLLGGDISVFAGGGGPIPIGDAAITVPRFRFVLGVMYAPVLRDTDGDGVPDKNDLCPDRAGSRGGDRPGCPASLVPTKTWGPDQTQEKRP